MAAGDAGQRAPRPSAAPGLQGPSERGQVAPPPTERSSPVADATGLGGDFIDEGDDTLSWHFRVLHPTLRSAEEADAGKRGIYPHAEPSRAFRQRAVEWVVRLHRSYQLRSLTLFLAVSLVDRYLARLQSKPAWLRQTLRRHVLLAATTLSIALKFEDEAVPEYSSLQEMAKGEFKVEDIHATELQVLSALDYHLHVPLAPHHLHWFLEVVGADSHHRSVAEYLCEVGLESPELPQWMPRDHAAASVVLSRMILSEPEWPPELEACCGVAEDEQLRAIIMKALFGLCRALYSTGPGHAVYDKHLASGLSAKIERIVGDVTGKSA